MKNRKPFRRISTLLSGLDDKAIKSISQQIKNNENDHLYIYNLFNRDEILNLMKKVLSKYEKNNDEIFLINQYLRQLKTFMNLLYSGINKNYDINSLLNNIASGMKCEEYNENTFLMKVGEIGHSFYVTLSGCVNIIIPKNINVKMSKRQYLFHLKLLYNYNEKYLFEKTLLLNNSFFPTLDIELVKVEDKKIKQGKQITINIDDYISNVNASNIKDDSFEEVYNLNIIGYYKVTELGKGSSFGEYALLNDDQQRTATIFVKKKSIFGTLNSNNFQNSISNIQDKIKKKNINFILSFQIFHQLSVSFFTNNYWNFFIHKKIEKDEYIFKKGNERNEIYFIEEGELKLIIPNLKYKKINQYISRLTKMPLKKCEMEDIGKSENVIITYIKKRDILGTDELLYEDKYICSALCESKSVSYFSINYEIIKNIMENFTQIKDSWNMLISNKTKLIIDRLNNIRNTYQSTLFGEFRKKEEQNIIYESGNDLNNQIYSFDCISPNLKKQYSKIKFKNIFLKTFSWNNLKKKKNDKEKKKSYRTNSNENFYSLGSSREKNKIIFPNIKTEFNNLNIKKKKIKSSSQSIIEEDKQNIKKIFYKEDKISNMISSGIYDESNKNNKGISILNYIIVDQKGDITNYNNYKQNIKLEAFNSKKLPPNFLKTTRFLLNLKKKSHHYSKSQEHL